MLGSPLQTAFEKERLRQGEVNWIVLQCRKTDFHVCYRSRNESRKTGKDF